MPEMLRTTVEEHIAVVTLDRPPVNVMRPEDLLEITAEFNRLSADQDVRVVVLTGAGDRAFCAGGDVKSRSVVTKDSMAKFVRDGRAAFTSIRDCSVPVIGAINGPALGGGLALAASCDILIVSDRATFALPEVNIGAWPMFKYLARLVPESKMRRMIFTAQRISAEEMASYGRIESVVPPDKLMPAALAMAREIAQKSSFLVRQYKQGFNRAEHLGVKETLPIEIECILQMTEHPDAAKLRKDFEPKKP